MAILKKHNLVNYYTNIIQNKNVQKEYTPKPNLLLNLLDYIINRINIDCTNIYIK